MNAARSEGSQKLCFFCLLNSKANARPGACRACLSLWAIFYGKLSVSTWTGSTFQGATKIRNPNRISAINLLLPVEHLPKKRGVRPTLSQLIKSSNSNPIKIIKAVSESSRSHLSLPASIDHFQFAYRSELIDDIQQNASGLSIKQRHKFCRELIATSRPLIELSRSLLSRILSEPAR